MRDHLICILRDARKVMTEDASIYVQKLGEAIEVEAMSALHGGVTIVPSKVFGDIEIPQNIITDMSNGADDLWLSHGCALDINIFHTSRGWEFAIYPVKNGTTDTDHPIEKGQL